MPFIRQSETVRSASKTSIEHNHLTHMDQKLIKSEMDMFDVSLPQRLPLNTRSKKAFSELHFVQSPAHAYHISE